MDADSCRVGSLRGETTENIERYMAIVDVKVPQLSESVAEATLLLLPSSTAPSAEEPTTACDLDALARSAEIDGDRITVEVKDDGPAGTRVVLRGAVRSFAEKHEAERIAWAAPGVTWVDNQIVIAA